MSIELKEIATSKEFKYLMNKYAECNKRYFDLLIKSKDVYKVDSQITRFKLICSSALDNEQFGSVQVEKRYKGTMELAVLQVLYERDVASFASRHYMTAEQVQELIDTKTYLAGA